jgi:uncharacterized PurR-regulated membrane protein YhhQ (DUF165 family)
MAATQGSFGFLSAPLPQLAQSSPTIVYILSQILGVVVLTFIPGSRAVRRAVWTCNPSSTNVATASGRFERRSNKLWRMPNLPTVDC